MLEQIRDLTPEAARGWFSYGLPIMGDLNLRLGVATSIGTESDLNRSLERIATTAHKEGILTASPGELVAAAILQSLFRYMLATALEDDVSVGSTRPLEVVRAEMGEAEVDACLAIFAEQYPPASGGVDPLRNTYEILLLQLGLDNHALDGIAGLFGPDIREGNPNIRTFIEVLDAQVTTGQGEGGARVGLLEFLREPLRHAPNDLFGQLGFVLKEWSTSLPETMRTALLRSRDVLEEERRMRGGGPGPVEPLVFSGHGAADSFGDVEYEKFTPDRDWMSNVVLMAKQTYVWLNQLSEKYERPIQRIDEIPDEELELLAQWGFTGLWLIGLWERSTASRSIKQRMGNSEAVASAYALYDYRIADDLGGEAAYERLKERAWAHGVRLAADMVPNHVGIDGDWVIEYPERFLQLSEPPFPNHRFDGPDLCTHPDVGVYLEDGYWDHSDAGVCFKRVDHRTGEARYIYHGNDGTDMPWNDTAQINYLNAEARAAVVDVIMDVARRFPIIRFDAAMTLARRHVQRLWFPPPGEGGAVPSRSRFGLTQADFDKAMPLEFWREVVDRINEELPDTLLLAEAFWMMEGYFVRTLGMHRVYNSAFMNMLKREDNTEYRATIKNTLEFSPQILKRFVNFMNNPDEDTAVAQFGKGDKYIGNAILMVTLPGLPMFGHGQIEGFEEKYGMEYARAYMGEQVDIDLVNRHRREVFPLMRRRHLFSEVEQFVFYDFEGGVGQVEEDVFAYSNQAGEERALVVYNNSYEQSAGWVRMSTPINRSGDEDGELIRLSLHEGLNIEADETLYRFRDHIAQTWFLRTGRQLADEGLYAELNGYQSQVFLDFEVVEDIDGAWRKVWDALDGAPCASLEQRRLEVLAEPCIPQWQAVLAALNAPAQLEEACSVFAEVLGLDSAVDGATEVVEAWATLQLRLTAKNALALATISRLASLRTLMPDDLWFGFRHQTGRALGSDDDVIVTEAVAVGLKGLMEGGRWDALFSEEQVLVAIRVNEHEGVHWFHEESMSAFVEYLFEGLGLLGLTAVEIKKASSLLVDAIADSGCRLDRLTKALSSLTEVKGLETGPSAEDA